MSLVRRSNRTTLNRSGSTFSTGNVPLVAVALVAFLVTLGYLLWEKKTLNALVLLAQSNPLALTLFLLVVVFGAVGAWLYNSDNNAYLGFGGLTLIMALSWVFSGFINGYLGQEKMMESVTVSKEATTPTYKQRAAYPVAHAQAKQAVSDQGTDLGDTRYIPSQDRYTGLVSKRGFFDGFSEVISQKVALAGHATSTRCSFSPQAADRFDAYLNHNLLRNATKAAGFGANFEESDAYGYCDEKNVPQVVLPYTRFHGFLGAMRVPGGVVIYHGDSGTYEVRTQVKAGDIPGPVYPASLSKDARDATVASGSFTDYIFGRVGFEDTEKDEGDPNGENRAEFNNQREDGKGADWVTPLTLRGASTSIAGLSTVSSDSITPGALNPMTIKRFETQRPANSAVLDRLKSDYNRDNLNWADNNLRIWEISPLNDKEWVASVGYSKNIIARVRLKDDLSSCLEDGNGKLIRCSTENGPSTSGPQAPTSMPSGTLDAKNLQDMTPQQLQQLQDAITKEMVRRLQAQGSMPR